MADPSVESLKGYDQPDTVTDPVPTEPRTELGYARRLIHVYGDRLRFVPTWNRWLLWDGTRWAHDSTGQAKRWMKVIARRVTTDAMAIENADTRRAAVRKAERAESSAGISGALTLASTEKEFVVDVDDLDADPFLVNCINGTLDLRTDELRDHEPGDLITKVAGAAYDPNAAGPEFVKFLERIQPDPEMRAFLARLLGHGLEGRQVEHLLPIFHGDGANGKSCLLDAVLGAVGDYGATTAPGLLTARSFDAHPTEFADLFGVRLAVLHETDSGRRLAEGTVKRVTGGDTIKARRMREDYWSFVPSHTFLMATNHKPLVGGNDEGIWRRLRLVPFEVVIPEGERDGDLPDRLALEADAVLAWLVAGYVDWREVGLAEPKQVATATASYRSESDALGRFIDEHCRAQPSLKVQSSALFNAWSRWCSGEGEDPGTSTAFATKLVNRGFDKQRTRSGAVWQGIGLLSDQAIGDGL